jgi:hypothetical protein
MHLLHVCTSNKVACKDAEEKSHTASFSYVQAVNTCKLNSSLQGCCLDLLCKIDGRTSIDDHVGH